MSNISQPRTNNVVLPQTDYEIIDIDPYFTRVISYFRASDYLKWGLFTVSGPILMSGIEYFESGKKRFRVAPGALRLSTFLGFTAGFLNQYVQSSLRFQGAVENSREVKLDRFAMKKRLSQGLSAYGEDASDLQQQWIRRAAAGNSTHSFNYLHMIPWFNLVHHEFHGVSLKKYYETRPGEEEWGFNLVWPEDKQQQQA